MTSTRSTTGRRIVVVSPHLDDGVLSLGAAMATWSRRGDRVELLTVFGCNPESAAPTVGWDRRGGFETEGEAARARRLEDREACARLGVDPVWLPFGSVDFERHGDERSVAEAVAEAVDGADEVFIPGFPLTHPDHVWLTRVLTASLLPCARIALYGEQPYTRRGGVAPRPPEWLAGAGDFRPARSGVRSRVSKWRAIRRYRSQLPLLALHRSLRRGPHVLAFTAELVAPVDVGADRSHH